MNETNEAGPLSPGDCVVLESGGPEMTVLDVGRETGLVWCRWMAGGEVKESSFPTGTVRRTEAMDYLFQPGPR